MNMKNIKLFENFDLNEQNVTWDDIGDFHNALASALGVDAEDLEIGGGGTMIDIFFDDKSLTDDILKHVATHSDIIKKAEVKKEGNIELELVSEVQD